MPAAGRRKGFKLMPFRIRLLFSPSALSQQHSLPSLVILCVYLHDRILPRADIFSVPEDDNLAIVPHGFTVSRSRALFDWQVQLAPPQTHRSHDTNKCATQVLSQSG